MAGDSKRTADPRQRIDRVNEWLYVGGAVPSGEYPRLAEIGIAQVVDLREQGPDDPAGLAGLGIRCHHAPVVNHTAPTDSQLEEVAAAIAMLNGKAPVYVHCAGGFGRATTMAVALLVREGTPLEEAFGQVKQARPEMELNESQLAWLRDLEARVRRSRGS